MRVNEGQEFVIGGYTVGGRTFDALVFGYYRGDKLIYVARTRNGFTPEAGRDQLMKEVSGAGGHEMSVCQSAGGAQRQMGQGLTAAKMKDCRWLLCRMRHSSHNVECRTMPHRVLQVLYWCIWRYWVRHNQADYYGR